MFKLRVGHVFIVIGVLMLLWRFICSFIVYSDGFQDGTITKLGKEGVIFKTYEGELALQRLNLWQFSITDEKVVKELERVASGTRLRLYYTQNLNHLPWVSNTDFLVFKFRRILTSEPGPVFAP